MTRNDSRRRVTLRPIVPTLPPRSVSCARPRASHANLSGFRQAFEIKTITAVFGSSAQYASKSLFETSARFPAEMKDDRPRLRCRAWSRIAIPSAPLCEYMPRLPVGGSTGAKVALSRMPGSVFSTPCSSARPSASRTVARSQDALLARPARRRNLGKARADDNDWRNCTPTRAHSAISASTVSAGVAITARSIGALIALTDRYPGNP